MLKTPLSGLILLATFSSYSAQATSAPTAAQTSTIQQAPIPSAMNPEPNAPLPSPALSYALNQVAPLTPKDVS
ncbi:conjugal transfer protein TraN, partial [Xenorhabdus bovienii]|nr:conjugal transfer protein TraN [Xenorhabdus bovienii]